MGDLKKILSMVWKRKDLEIGYVNKFLQIIVEKNKRFNANEQNFGVELISEALDESPCRVTKEARALAETIKLLDELVDLGYYTSLVYRKRKCLRIKAELGGDSFTWEITDVDKHDYACFVRKLVKINKDIKKIV